MRVIFAVLLVLLIPAPVFAGLTWCPTNGNLHDVTVVEWYAASQQNRVCTSADWVVTLVDKSKHGLLIKNDGQLLQIFANQLAQCVTDGNMDNGKILMPSIKVRESAALCWTLIVKSAK